MFIGGCAGSTTGYKIFRFQILFKYFYLHLKKILQPYMVLTAKFNGKMSMSQHESVMTFFIYLVTFAFSIIIII